MRLTQKIIREATEPGFLWDAEIPRFGIKVLPSGKKSFILDYTFKRKRRRKVLGRFPALTLKQARGIAKKILYEAANGNDPDAPTGGSVTLREYFWNHFITNYPEGTETRRNYTHNFRNHIEPVFGNRPMGAVARAEVSRFYAEQKRSQRESAIIRVRLIRIVYRRALADGFLPEGAANPTDGIQIDPFGKRDRFLSREEIDRLLESVGEEFSIHLRSAIILYLLTGLRHKELLRAEWEHLDTEKRTLYVPENKAGRPFYAPLSDMAVEVFKSIPKIHGNPYIFPSPNKPGSHYTVFPFRVWERIRERAGLPDVRIHDLRRTFASHLAMGGASLHVIAKALNQTTLSVTQQYAHLTEDAVREAIRAHGGTILGGGGIKG